MAHCVQKFVAYGHAFIFYTAIITFLKSSLGDSHKYKHKVMEDGEKHVSFRRITSNIR